MTSPIIMGLVGILGNALQQFASEFLIRHIRRLPGAGGSDALTAAQSEKLVDATVRGLAQMRAGELATLPDHEWRAAMEAVRDSLGKASVDMDSVFESNLEATKLAGAVEASSAAVLHHAGLAEGDGPSTGAS